MDLGGATKLCWEKPLNAAVAVNNDASAAERITRAEMRDLSAPAED